MSIFLQNIAIRDFRTFGAFEIELPAAPGLVIVSGPNGLGKSSFFDALEWCLTSNVRRFGKYLRRGDTEADYLTREKAAAFCHKVQMQFSDGSRIDRAGSEYGAKGTADEELKNILVAAGWTQKIESLSTYLGLTHFLGQGSQQRFMSLETNDQWQALRVPAGVDRLEQIRKRIRGTAATQAINRKAEAANNTVVVQQEELARWDALIERLRRLETLAEVTSTVPRDQIALAAKSLYLRIPLLQPQPLNTSADGLESTLIEIHTRLAESRKILEAEESRLAGLSRLPDQYTLLESQRTSTRISLHNVEQAKIQSFQALTIRAQAVERVELEKRKQEAQVRRLREQSAFLLAATQDLRDSSEATLLRATLEAVVHQTQSQIVELESELTQCEQALQALKDARNNVEIASKQNSDAIDLRERAAKLDEVMEHRAAAATRLSLAKATLASFSVGEILENERVATAALGLRAAELDSRRERAGAITSALAIIASHLDEDASDCPLCKTHFGLGEIKRLAELSASETDDQLIQAKERVSEAAQSLKAAQELKGGLARASAEVEYAEATWNEIDRATIKLRNELLARLNLTDPATDIKAITAARLLETERRLDSAQRLQATHETTAVVTLQAYSRTQEQLSNATKEVSRLQNDILRVRSDEAAATRRFTIRSGEVALTPDEVPAQLANTQAEIDEAEAKLASLVATHLAGIHELNVAQMDDEQLAGRLGEQQAMLNSLDREVSEVESIWTSSSMPLPVSGSNLEAKLSDLLRIRSDFGSLEAERVRLATAVENTSTIEELEHVRALVGNSANGSTVEAHRSAIVAAIEESKLQRRKIQGARDAIVELGARLQDEAEAFTNNFLAPLNDLIGSFNDALLTSPGTSVFFKTDHMANRTQLSARLRRRKNHSDLAEIRPIDPQLILSEGQLAANGFSILCSSSVSYRWSNWRSLLLDDPLQHNDVIHAAAFTDVMRNLVELERYQVFMSSHDRAETEFMERKFSAGGLPCTVVQLMADSEEGVTYDVRHNNCALKLMKDAERRLTG